MTIMNALRDGGWGALLSVLLGGFAFTLSLASLSTSAATRGVAARVVTLAALAFVLSCVAVGVFGTVSGRRMTHATLASGSIDPVMRTRIEWQGYSEAQQSARFGAFASLIPALLTGAAWFLAETKRRRDAEP